MRYHLNIRDAASLILDDEGVEFPNLRAPRVEARACAAELPIDGLHNGGPICKQPVEICDDTGALAAGVGFIVLLHEDCELKSPGAATGHRGGARKHVDPVAQS